MTLEPGAYSPEEVAAGYLAEPTRPALEERVAAIEAALAAPPVVTMPEGWTPEQVAEFEHRFGETVRKHQIRWLPPGPLLTPELACELLRGCVTVVRPGEVLVVRVPEPWTPDQAAEYQQWLNYEAGEAGIKALVVVGEELGVAEHQDDPA